MKKIVLLSAIIVSACTQLKPEIDQKKFEALYRSAKTIQGATSVGVSYVKLGELMQGLATEISIARDRATTAKEKEMVAAYMQAFEAYKDCQTLWAQKIEFSYTSLTVIYDTPNLIAIAEKYGIPTHGNAKKTMTINEATIQLVLYKAGEILERGNKLYLSQGSMQK